MRNPGTHAFLKYAGPALVVFVGGCLGLVAGFATAFPGFRLWIEARFAAVEPVVTGIWFLAAAALLIIGYFAALIWSGRPLPIRENDPLPPENVDDGPRSGRPAGLLINWLSVEGPRAPGAYRILLLTFDFPLCFVTSPIMSEQEPGTLFACELINIGDAPLTDVDVVAKVQFLAIDEWEHGKRSGDVLSERFVSIKIPWLGVGGNRCFGFHVLNSDNYFACLEFPAFGRYSTHDGAAEILPLTVAPDDPVMRLLPRQEPLEDTDWPEER